MTALAAALALIAAAGPESVSPSGQMDLRMKEYFAGEMAESYAWAGLGLVGLGTSIPLFASGDKLGRPAAVPIFALALVQLALGIGLWVRTPGQVAKLSAQLHEDPVLFAQAERARMKRVNQGFRIYRVVELGLLFTAVGGLAGTGWINHDDSWVGAGLGLVIECVVFLALDFFADARGAGYEAALLGFHP